MTIAKISRRVQEELFHNIFFHIFKGWRGADKILF